MAVLIEFYSVIIPVSVINKKYHGGLARYKADIPNNSYHDDGELTRVGFMDSGALYVFLERLLKHGIAFNPQEKRSDDFVLVQYLQGLSWHVDWLEYGADGYARYLDG